MKPILTLFFALFINASFAAPRERVIGKDSMVVTAQHRASEIGQAMLEKGGNAIDAAVAIGYALAVVHPCCGNIGGGGFMLIRFANGRSTFINFREQAPLLFDQKLFDQQRHTRFPYLTVGVPGTVLGLNTALEKYGHLPRQVVMQPAIDLAKKGFILSQQDAKIFKLSESRIRSQPNIAKIFLRNNATLPEGETLTQPALARTLSLIAKEGSKAFYHGSIAKKIAQASKAEQGLLTTKDFKHYSIQELKPLQCNYRGYNILTAPPPSAGGATLCEVLNITELYPLSKYGLRSAKAIHVTVEAMRHSFADRNQFLGDPDFVKNPLKKLLSKQHAKMIQQRINPTKKTDSKKLGFISNQSEKPNTTGYVVVDAKGNAVAVTYTLNGSFGAGRIAEDTGFFLNNEMGDFNLEPGKPNSFGLIQGNANKAQPGKRPLSSMAPTIITKNGKLFMLLSTPGGSTIPTQLINVIHNVIDYDMNIQAAIDAPRFHMQWMPDKIFIEPHSFSARPRRLLRKMGHAFQLGAPWGAPFWGAVAAIKVDPKTGVLYGAMDNRRPAGIAIGR